MSKLKTILVALASVVLFSNITNAQALKASYSANYEEPLNVKYLGDDGDYLLFQVTLQAKTPKDVFFAIDDNNEGKLYSSGLTSNFKVRTFKIEKSEDDQVLNFKLVLGRKTFSKSFSVNKKLVQTTTVSESDITRL
ncbi:MAG: hypothetical protein H7Z13_03000 [Ferruginibacter sp.]|nr:hypothetical protein [Ferruginibacter sp.]